MTSSAIKCCVSVLLFLLLFVTHVNHWFKSITSCEILYKLKCAHDHNYFHQVFKGNGCLYGSLRQMQFVVCRQLYRHIILRNEKMCIIHQLHICCPTFCFGHSTCFKQLQRKHLIVTATWFVDIELQIIILQVILFTAAA